MTKTTHGHEGDEVREDEQACLAHRALEEDALDEVATPLEPRVLVAVVGPLLLLAALSHRLGARGEGREHRASCVVDLLLALEP